MSLETDFKQPKDTLIAQILNHYQVVGNLLQRGVLDKDLVYSEYFNKLNHYFTVLQSYMVAYRKEHEDPTIWKHVDWLYKKLSVIERKNLPRGADIKPTHEDIVEFFHEEKNLKRA